MKQKENKLKPKEGSGFLIQGWRCPGHPNVGGPPVAQSPRATQGLHRPHRTNGPRPQGTRGTHPQKRDTPLATQASHGPLRSKHKGNIKAQSNLDFTERKADKDDFPVLFFWMEVMVV
ncbi:hypothetical protein Salat_2334900 [Sesamum alatum]|uniref:Uncharacterized protein n=1 Tax=Sesamum alatum TaxID=300844 RepID=A0AAE1XX47_9LAMI|nr:hypothetical protein Salat_2334900 [Sesamum alatum]